MDMHGLIAIPRIKEKTIGSAFENRGHPDNLYHVNRGGAKSEQEVRGLEDSDERGPPRFCDRAGKGLGLWWKTRGDVQPGLVVAF